MQLNGRIFDRLDSTAPRLAAAGRRNLALATATVLATDHDDLLEIAASQRLAKLVAPEDLDWWLDVMKERSAAPA